MDGWFAAARPAVLTGTEGLGKPWLFLSWWLDRHERKVEQPLTFFVPSREIRDESALELLGRLLFQRLQSHNQAFWSRRFNQWMQRDGDNHPFILVIDGLNQSLMKRDWADLLQPLYDDRVGGKVAPLLTCWPDTWRDLHQLSAMEPAPHEIKVAPFDDGELDALLELNGLKRSDFGREMLELMKLPRLSALAIARRADLAASGDITPERLAFEDWKHRIERRGSQLALTSEEFMAFVRDVGKELQSAIDATSFTRKELLDRLGRESGKQAGALQDTVAELVAGRWLEPGDTPKHFKLSRSHVSFALGMMLTHQLSHVADQSEADSVISDLIDPLSGQSLGAAILRAAVTTGLLNPEIERPTRRALVLRWLGEQIFMQSDFDAFWRVIGLDADLLLQVIEDDLGLPQRRLGE